MQLSEKQDTLHFVSYNAQRKEQLVDRFDTTRNGFICLYSTSFSFPGHPANRLKLLAEALQAVGHLLGEALDELVQVCARIFLDILDERGQIHGKRLPQG